MKIGFDARTIISPRKGLGRATHMLLKHIAENDCNNEYYVFLDKNDLTDEIPNKKNIHKVVIPSLNYVTWEQITLRKALSQYNLDIFHFPVGTAPIDYDGKYILTIHDLTRFLPVKLFPRYSPKLSEKISRLYVNWLMPRVARKAARVIAISENTKRDVTRYLGVEPESIEVIYEAQASIFRILENQDTVKECIGRYRIPEKYIFSLGSRLGYKNTSGLIRAYGYYASRHRGNVPPLVIAGMGGDARLLREIEVMGLRERIVILDHISDRDLVALYNAATFFIFPSLYEGFGFPPLEAMACGTPVICSNRASLPEVVGDAAYLVDPEDRNQLADAMEIFAGNGATRDAFREKGLKRAKEFSWDLAARKVIDVYRKSADSC
jgi:glycosyltransferase involved in cell wall biosynthesis